MMFSGLMSRCTMPASWAASSALAIWMAVSSATNNFIGAEARYRRSVWPSMNSVEM